MAKEDYDRGVRDGQHGHYNPPHDRSPLREIVQPLTSDERNDRQDYEQGRQHGMK